MKPYKKIAVLVLMFSSSVWAESTPRGISVRLLSDFLAAQGSTSSFFAPVPDYNGWIDGSFDTFALVDYAGLADSLCSNLLGTKVDGHVLERPLNYGKAEITVILNTKNALGFAQSISDLAEHDFNFMATPTLFGNKVVDV